MLNTLKSIFIALSVACFFVACDSDTYTLGGSLISDMDHLTVSTGTFELSTRSIVSDAVIARNSTGYLGTVKDPETGEYISANYMTQFHTLENYEFPEAKLMQGRDENNAIIADSCELRLFFDKYYGDSLSTMKLAVYEMAQPMHEDVTYYSDFDPKESGLVRSEGFNANCAYTLCDMNISKITREESDYSKNIRIPLTQPYTDKNGKTYNNYGSYVLSKYYEDKSYFKNAIRLTNNVIPGMYVESTGGLGSMAYIKLSQLNIFFHYGMENKDTTMTGVGSFAGTQEVMQYTRYINDNDCLQKLANEDDCTYMKTPSGIFTEITFPVDEITASHSNDTINSAKFSLQRMNNKTESDYAFAQASTVLLIPADSLNTFFENNYVINNKNSYLATYDSSKGVYTFNNVGSMIKAMQLAKHNGETSENWNKAVVVPVTVSKSSTGEITSVVHDMSLTSTRLVGGPNNPHEAIKIDVIYSKYE